jgi:sugar phosphate isomerase/epimerase
MTPKEIRDAGLKLIYHNHNFEMARFDGKTGLDILMEHTQPDWFQFEVDTYWVAAGGGDPSEWILKMDGRMDVVHFKDMVYDPASKGAIFAEIGQGNLNWQEIVRSCGQIGAKWHIVEQDVCRRDPYESLAISYRYLQHLGLR